MPGLRPLLNMLGQHPSAAPVEAAKSDDPVLDSSTDSKSSHSHITNVANVVDLIPALQAEGGSGTGLGPTAMDTSSLSIAHGPGALGLLTSTPPEKSKHPSESDSRTEHDAASTGKAYMIQVYLARPVR